MARVLLHMCCGPCAIVPIRRLQEEGHEVTGFFWNPNIHPLREYLRRREAVQDVARELGISVICKDGEYDPKLWFRAVSFREENRCFHCYALRLERAMSIARRGRFDAMTTSILYSRKQRHDMVRQLGEDMAGGGSVRFLYRDFREGWQEGIETSKGWGVYRQQYCGCLYSEGERYARELREVSGDAARNNVQDAGEGRD